MTQRYKERTTDILAAGRREQHQEKAIAVKSVKRMWSCKTASTATTSFHTTYRRSNIMSSVPMKVVLPTTNNTTTTTTTTTTSSDDVSAYVPEFMRMRLRFPQFRCQQPK